MLENLIKDKDICDYFKNRSYTLEGVSSDASKKLFYRILLEDQRENCIFMKLEEKPSAEDVRKEDWYNLSKILTQSNIRCPDVLACSEDKSQLVIEDCGQLCVQDLINKLIAEDNQKGLDDLYAKCFSFIFKFLSFSSNSKNQATWEKRSFDNILLKKELLFFREHFILKNQIDSLKFWDERSFLEDVDRLCASVASISSYFTHRDFHSRNLLVSKDDLVVIDFQDARLGPSSYDIVSLIFDPYVELDLSRRKEIFDMFFSLAKNFLPAKVTDEILNSWKMVCLQRLLKALGSYAFMEKEGKKSFTNYILPTLKTLNDLNLNDSRWEFLSHTLSYELLYAFSE